MRSRLAAVLGVALFAASASVVVAAPAQALPNGCSDAGATAAATKYLEALQDGSKAWAVPATWDVVRFENGLLTAFTAPQLKLDLSLHLQYSVMSNLRNVQWTYAPDGRGDVVRADYDLSVGLPGLPPMDTAHVKEDFTMTPACQIKKIVADIKL